MYNKLFKRLIDFTVSLLGLIILSPLFLIVTIALAIANNGKSFFFQERLGKDERIFQVIKFKSMNDKRDAAGNLLPDMERLTRMDKFARKTEIALPFR